MPRPKMSDEEKAASAQAKIDAKIGAQADSDTALAAKKAAQKLEDQKPVDTVKIAMDTKAILDAKPKVMFMIPLGAGEKKGATETACINGHRYEVMKGMQVSLPEPVAMLLMKKYEIEAAVGEGSLDSRPDAQAALS